ncbi:MAG: hypothetical protein ACYCZW_00595 [Minisyncoccota bacterium]
MSDFLDTKTVYTVIHVFGAILGAGGAFVSDGMFFDTIKDGRVTKRELDFMRLGGKFVWMGLAILFVSGVLLVSTDPLQYLTSSKFLVKLTIVSIITINGIIFHTIHIPHIRNHLGLKLKESKTFLKKSSFIMTSGALSFVSWVFTVILGSLRTVPYGYVEIFGVYVVCVVVATISALIMKRVVLHIK